MTMRAALVNRHSHTNVEAVRAYLPRGYSASELESGAILILGEDRAGWTLDDYVIPRLASGLIVATEIV